MKLRGKAKAEFLARMKKGRDRVAKNLTAAKRNPKRKATVKRKVPPKRKVIVKRRVMPKTKAKVKRSQNPRASHSKQVNGAVELFRRFTGMEPKYTDSVKNPMNGIRAGMVIGKLAGVLYDTVRDGEKLQYIHEFTGRSRPTLCASWDGKQIFIVDGHYNFTDEGIVDK